MIHWIWLIGAFILGEAVGLYIAAILSAADSMDQEHKQTRR